MEGEVVVFVRHLFFTFVCRSTLAISVPFLNLSIVSFLDPISPPPTPIPLLHSRTQLTTELQRAAAAHTHLDADRQRCVTELQATEADRDRALQLLQV